MISRRTYLRLVAGGATVGLSGAGRGAHPLSRAAGTQTISTTQQAKLATGGGRDVSLAGDTALVGDWRAEAAYVFERSERGWNQQATLTPSDGDRGDEFGSGVTLVGDTAIIGAHYDNTPNGEDAGSAYVFERSDGTWNQQAKLIPGESDGPNEFGDAVALAEDTALIGAHDTYSGGMPGAAYVFERSGGTWSQQAKLAPDDSSPRDEFGAAVALTGDTALVGAWRTGSAYVFERSDGTWNQQAKLPSDEVSVNFGMAVALVGDTVLIGSPFKQTSNGMDTGAAYVFERSGGEWNQQTRLAAEDGDSDDEFGAAVALTTDIAVIGAYQDEDPNGEGAGSAYVFERSDGTWNQQAKLFADDGDSGDRFGRSVALAEDTALIGASFDETPNESWPGSAYVFDLGADETNPSSPPDVTGNENPAQDPDDDGLYEDVNGDGEATPGDATVLFDSVFNGDNAVMDNVSLFDFNGDDSLTPGDATVLFNEIF